MKLNDNSRNKVFQEIGENFTNILCTGDRSLQHDRLLEDLKNVHQWQNLGTALGVSRSKMDDIHGDNIVECQRNVLNEWIVANPQCKCGDLVLALRSIGEHHTANNIARKYFGAEFRPSVFEKTPLRKGW